MNTIDATVLYARRYDFEGNKGASLLIIQDTEQDDPNAVGKEVMKIGAPYTVVEQIKAAGVKLPATASVVVEFRPGKGGAMAMRARDLQFKAATKPATGTAKAS